MIYAKIISANKQHLHKFSKAKTKTDPQSYPLHVEGRIPLSAMEEALSH